MTVLVYADERFALHDTGPFHPERPDRLHAVTDGLVLAGVDDDVERVIARPATDEELFRVHPEAFVRGVEAFCRSGRTHLDADTVVSSASADLARLGSGAGLDAIERLRSGDADAAFVAPRPPGHHATASRAMGFCLYNHVAVAAAALAAAGERVAVIDVDAHHGNGTQHAFERDPSVLYVSTHQFPYYPGTGGAGEIGVEEGRGATVNVPLPAGSGDEEYTGVFERVLVPVARCYAPQAILVSCGFDAHRDDPLASMEVTRAGFLAMARIVRSLAEELCGGRVALVLEGGYAESGLREGTSAVLEALLEPARAVPDPR
ncbi:MAG: histone deacetylase, partial [Microthrixaceae bacterium]|nr:histone deacetylase [Microthrixaceae bacterium]